MGLAGPSIMFRLKCSEWSCDVYSGEDQTVPLAIFNGWSAKQNAEIFMAAMQGQLGRLEELQEEVEFLRHENTRLRKTVGVPANAILDWND